MMPGPAIVLSCPFCGGKKEVMNLASGNTFGATVWSDGRRHYPMLPEVSPIQQCPHCKKYYFIDQAKVNYSDDPASAMRSFNKLGKLTYKQLLEAYIQMDSLTLTRMQRWTLHYQLLMAYNDAFRREPESVAYPPTEVDEVLFHKVVDALLEELRNGIDPTPDAERFQAEFLREIGRFEEAREVLMHHEDQTDRWEVDAMLRHIDDKDPLPFLLLKDGVQVG